VLGLRVPQSESGLVNKMLICLLPELYDRVLFLGAEHLKTLGTILQILRGGIKKNISGVAHNFCISYRGDNSAR
jgi:hypothetical protein